MRADVDDAIEAACAPRPNDRPVIRRRDPVSNAKTRAQFVARLKVFLEEVPQDFTLQELLEEVR